MPSQPLWRRIQGLWWDQSPRVRLPLRRLRRRLSLMAYRLRDRRGAGEAPRIVPKVVPTDPAERIPHPAIAVGGDPHAAARFLAGQTESSARPEDEAAKAPFCLPAPPATDDLPSVWLESLLLSAATESLPITQAGFAPPATGEHGPSGELHLPASSNPLAHTLVRMSADPSAAGQGAGQSSTVLGRVIPQIASLRAEAREEVQHPILRRSGPYLLDHGVPAGSVLHQNLRSPSLILSQLPAIEGKRTVLFLLPFLAIGGAESLLFDLLEGMVETSRCLVVTFEPHLAHRGETVERCRAITPHVYTLGDWLPREANLGALLHLLRRYRVESLVCWNGTTDFYDGLEEIKATFPDLRVLSQHFNHRGAWIERTSPGLIRQVDIHLAVNRPIARSLERERGVPKEAIRLVHHGVALPDLPTKEDKEIKKGEVRRQLGLPEDAVVAGTFIRLHPQKRPKDILHLARRTRDRGLYFLLAGGGPLDEDIDRELAAKPIPNLVRLSMQDDVESLYGAVDLCLSTSAYEGLPVFLLDGLARGLPVVSTAVGDIPFLLEEGGGLLAASPGHLEQLEAALLRMLDPELRQIEGEKGRQRVARDFSLAPYRQRYLEAIFPSESKGKAP